MIEDYCCYLLRDSCEDCQVVEVVLDIVQICVFSYWLVFNDNDFLCCEDLCFVCLQLELLKLELLMNEYGIDLMIVMFGGVCIFDLEYCE